jgi:hypothetical protein
MLGLFARLAAFGDVSVQKSHRRKRKAITGNYYQIHFSWTFTPILSFLEWQCEQSLVQLFQRHTHQKDKGAGKNCCAPPTRWYDTVGDEFVERREHED